MPSELNKSIVFPSLNTKYNNQPAAWVRFKPQAFSTQSVENANAGGAGSYTLPLQVYRSPNQANYVDTTPSGSEMIGQGIRDMFTGGGAGKLTSMFTNTPLKDFGIAGLGDMSVSNIVDAFAGAGGASTFDISYSDLTFKNMQKRIHTFTFFLYAKNKQDAYNIDAIANGMQTRMYPKMYSKKTNKIEAPCMWDIDITVNGGPALQSKILTNHIQKCILSSFDVVRLDKTSPVLTKDNLFIGLNLQATFTEIQPAYRDTTNDENIVSRSTALLNAPTSTETTAGSGAYTGGGSPI